MFAAAKLSLMKKLILIAAVSICSANTLAQLVPADTSSKVLNLKEEVSPSAPAESHFNNIIRYNFLEMGRGIFSVGYERRLSNYFSVDVQLGISTRDYGGDLQNSIFDDNTSSSSSGDDDLFPFGGSGNSYKSYGAFCFMVGVRIYPFAKGNLEGFYVEPHYYSKKWDYDKTITNESYDSGYGDETSEKLTYIFKPTEQDAGIKCGWQFQGGDGRFCFNPYVGLAFRSRDKYTIENETGVLAKDRQDDYFNPTNRYRKTVEKKSGPGIVLGLNFGIAF